MNGKLVISLDFELLWGVRDHADRNRYGKNVLGARHAIPRILELFSRRKVKCTWATVGFLFCESKEELLEYLPEELPRYSDPLLSNYSYLDEVGRDEKSDPYYFAPSLISEIRQTPGQEVGTHTFSHYYCLEDVHSLSAFEADIVAAKSIAIARSVEISSIVFPRNQFDDAHIKICAKHGVTHYRGNPTPWAYKPAKGAEQTSARRALRLLDAYTGVLGSNTFNLIGGQPKNVPASRFLRPYSRRMRDLHPLHIATIKRGMTMAAKTGAGYHIWWHPHNFGCDLDTNLRVLEQILEHFEMLRDSFGMVSLAMRDL